MAVPQGREHCACSLRPSRATNGEVAVRLQIDTGPDYCEHSQASLSRYVAPCLSASTTYFLSERPTHARLISQPHSSILHQQSKIGDHSCYPKNIPSSRHSCEAHISLLDADFTQPVTLAVSSADLRTYITPIRPHSARFQIRNVSHRSTFSFAKARKSCTHLRLSRT